ncbi:MAG: TonB-dependent receptor domain-containing protein [Wenzhouxiangella sp.]
MTRPTSTGLATAGLLFTFSSLWAETEIASEPMMVTATRSEQPASASLASVSIIDRDQIERSQAPDLFELLRLEAGVDITRTGGPGGQTSLFLRGSNSNHVLVLIDGIRVAAAGTGAFAWELLDPAIVERIEIVRGPRAARWGSDAIGGVIQIFTRQAEGVSARAAYGRFRDRSLTSSFGTGTAGLTVAARRVGGFSSQNERGFAFDPDDDGFRNFSATTAGSAVTGPGLLSWNARMASGETEFDQGESDFLNYAGGLEYRTTGSGPWQWQASTAAYRDRLETETAFGTSEVITRRVQAGVQAETRVGESSSLLVGVDGWRESGVSRNQWSENRYNIGIWSGVDGSLGRFDHEASLRLDRDELFGSAVTGNLAGGWRPADAWRVSAGIGRGFRAPDFSQLFSPGFGGLFAGNPDLDPETSWSTEAGLQWLGLQNQRFSLALFDTRTDDLIDFAGTDFQAINIRKARIQGAELSHTFSSRAWRSQASYTWQDAEDRDTGQALLRRPKEKAALSVDRLLANGSWFGGEVLFNGSRLDVGQQDMPSYTLINLRAGWSLPAGFRLEGRIENLTDRDYEQLFGFNTHGRSLFVALSWEG